MFSLFFVNFVNNLVFIVDKAVLFIDFFNDFSHSNAYKAIAEGSNCFGYHLWTPIDCFSWRNSYRNRYGLISVDIRRQIKTLKKSAYFFKDLADTSRLELHESEMEK